MKKVLIIGNEGYIGPIICDYLKSMGDYFVGGFDIGYFTENSFPFSRGEKKGF